jgi:hypothetical protein
MAALTKRLYLLNRLLCSPLEAMFTLLIFILGKEGGATPFQLAVIAAAKPLVSIFAFYLSSLVVNRPSRIKGYLILTTLCGALPCFAFPFQHNPWFFVASFALFAMMSRAAFPAWAEILKSNVGLERMSGIISKGTSINYSVLLSLPLLFSFWMDQQIAIWKVIFLLLAALQLFNLMIVLCLTIETNCTSTPLENKRMNLLVPLKEGWRVLKETPQFANYLLMFFLGGVGIVLAQSVLPIYFTEVLNLSYMQLTLAFSCCKGIAFVVSSPIWARYANRVTLFLINGIMNLFTCLFFLSLFASSIDLKWLYLGYLFYGMMQAGSELSWNLSGPIFSEKRESTLFSSLNLIMVGLRGCLCPFLGQFLLFVSGANGAFAFAILLTILSLFYAFWLNHVYSYRKSDHLSFVTRSITDRL